MEAAFYHKGPNIKMEPFWDEKKKHSNMVIFTNKGRNYKYLTFPWRDRKKESNYTMRLVYYPDQVITARYIH